VIDDFCTRASPEPEKEDFDEASEKKESAGTRSSSGQSPEKYRYMELL